MPNVVKASDQSSAQQTSWLPVMVFRVPLMLLASVIALSAVTIDQVSKMLITQNMVEGEQIDLLGTFLSLHFIRNPGAAFGLGQNVTWIFGVAAIIALLVILLGVFPRLDRKVWAVICGVMTGGIAGNLIDRIAQPPGGLSGHVVDFLQLPYWPIFNVADMCLVCGAIALVITMFVLDRETKK